MAHQLRPDVILMDYSMPKMNGVSAARAIRSKLPDVKIIGLSMYEEEDRAKAMLEAGASAYINKSGEFDKLLNTIFAAYKSSIHKSVRSIIDIPSVNPGKDGIGPLKSLGTKNLS